MRGCIFWLLDGQRRDVGEIIRFAFPFLQLDEATGLTKACRKICESAEWTTVDQKSGLVGLHVDSLASHCSSTLLLSWQSTILHSSLSTEECFSKNKYHNRGVQEE
jgi:hypothetical protein